MSYGIWGTGVYTIDSSICMAAVHSGAIPREAGGLVAVTRMPGQASYPSSTSNGVTSSAWTTYYASFRVGTAVPDAPMGPAPAVHIYAGSLTLMMTWPPLPGTPAYSVCRESPPGAACQPVGVPVVNAAGNLYLADTYLPPNTVHAYRVRATYPDGRVGETRVTRRNEEIGPPLNPSVDFARFASNGTVQVSWEPYGMPGMNGPIMFDTHLAMGPGITRGQVVTGDRLTVQPPQLPSHEWHICSMVANPAGGWWYSDRAAIVRYTAAGGGTITRSTGPCNVLPQGEGTILVPPRP
jgi:hypothetical protein